MDSLQSVIPQVLRDVLQQGPMSQGKLEIAWRVSVGDALSRAATVRLIPDGSVEVHPADQRWSHELKRSSDIILSRLKALLGSDTITRISVIGGPEEKPRKAGSSR